MKHFTVLLFLILVSTLSFPQGIKGVITDSQGKPIPYATIFVKEVSLGSTSNSNGAYQFKLSQGSYTLQVRSVGYSPVVLSVTIDTSVIENNIVLEKQVVKLHEIRVYAKDEDPAYPIMRRAISMAPYYMNQVKEYNADVYLKGTAILEKVPKLLKKSFNAESNGETMKVGELYVGENFSEVAFEAPNIYNQKVISSNMSMMQNQQQTFDMGLITESAYQPEMDIMIMPFSPQAFANYKFRYEGYFNDGNYLVNKIKMIPKRKSKQLFDGYLYIIDGLWCLHSITLETKQFFGTIKTFIQFAELQDMVWMPISHKIAIDGKMMGVKGKANYASSVKYKSFKLNVNLNVPPLLEEFVDDLEFENELEQKEKSIRQQKIEELMQKEELKNRDAIRLSRLMQKEAKEIEKQQQEQNGNKPSLEIQNTYKVESADSATLKSREYWEEMRPNPLTTEERISFVRSDSIQLVKLAKKDSIAADTLSVKAKSEFWSKLISGGKISGDSSKLKVHYKGLVNPEMLSFNPVDGWRYKQQLKFNRKIDSISHIEFSPWLGYAFNANKLQWNVYVSYKKHGLKKWQINASAGSVTTDYMGDNGISQFINTISSLMFKENYARYYRQNYLNIAYQTEVVNGLTLKSSINYASIQHPKNATNYSFFRQTDLYHPNEINQPSDLVIPIEDESSATFDLSLHYTPRQYYSISKGKKYSRGSKWPTFTLSYSKGVQGILNSKSNFDHLEFVVQQKVDFGVYSKFNYGVRAGTFLNNEHVHFADFARMKVSPVPVEVKGLKNTFYLLPYYTYNTNQWYAEAHAIYTTPYLLLKYLPILSERLWRENIHFSYLSTPDLNNYMEIGYSLSEIMFAGDLGVFCGFDDFQYQRVGVRMVWRF